MKLLLDANLSWRLIEPLLHHFPQVEHVNRISVPPPITDEKIWTYAKANGFCIVTNDEDFQNILLKKGFPPKLILLRMGNQRNDFIKDILIKHRSDVDSLEKSAEHGILEIYE